MPNVVKVKSVAPTRKSPPNVKALQKLLKLMEREVTKLGKELERSRHKTARAPAPRQSKQRGAASAKAAPKTAKKAAMPRKAARTKGLR